MGNVCSSGQKKKKDSLSEKSDDSPAYQAANKKKHSQISTELNNEKLAPLADPEPEPDIPNGGRGGGGSIIAQQQPTLLKNSDASTPASCGVDKTCCNDFIINTPATASAPSDISDQNSPTNYMTILQGRPPPARKIERDTKIVIYILADNSSEYEKHKRVIYSLYRQFTIKCQSKGFDFIISDIHDTDTKVPGNSLLSNKKDFSKLLEVERWSQSPIEARGGHEQAANCLSEITRHSISAYVIPILFLGSTLGMPMLPLTIESQDFNSVLNAASEDEEILLKKWYTIDNSYQPICHRLYTEQAEAYSIDVNGELNDLLHVLLKLFSDDLKDSYLTTVVEQEINNTVLMSQELAKRCIWIQTGTQYSRAPDNATHLELEVLRRITKIYNELKTHLSEKNLIRILPTMNILDEELTAVIESLLDKSIANILEEHTTKNSLPLNTNGVDRVLLDEVQLIGHYSKMLAQNSANFDIMNDVKTYVKDSNQYPLIVSGASGSGKSVLVSKIMENVHRWQPEANLILRYSNLTAHSSDLLSLLGSVTNQISVLVNGCQYHGYHNLDCYSRFLHKLMGTKKCLLVLIIDSVDDILHGDASLNWLPIQLRNMKIILTITDNSSNTDQENLLLNKLRELGIPNKNFIKIKQFTERQWSDIVTSGGGDFYGANSALKLPEDWKNLHGKTPFHAKSLWWLAWLGHLSVTMTEISDIVIKMLQVFESKFDADHAEILLLIVSLSKWGIRENDCLGIFQKHVHLEAQVAFKIWSKFCWLMGPMMVCLKNIKVADNAFSNAVLTKYAPKQWLVHKYITEYFDSQESIFSAAPGDINQSVTYNRQKFLKLPYHHFCSLLEGEPTPAKNDMLFNCFYLTDLQWIADKVHSCGPIHLMHDILISQWLSGLEHQPYVHISFLKDFLCQYMQELNYDGHQFFTLMKFYLKTHIKADPSMSANEKICLWFEFTNEIRTPCLEILNDSLGKEIDQPGNGNSPEVHSHSSYDVLVNLPQKGFYVASISTEREEICVWDVQNYSKVRELHGIPQPTAMCPVSNYVVAVLCRREIKVINLDEGCFKVTLKGVMNQKMPYFGLHDENHLVCLSRNRMYVNLMNLESGDCVTTFKAGEDRFLNSLLISGDGRILVCGDETQKPFPLLVWHLSQRKLLYDLRIPHHDFITSLSAITYEGSYVCVVAKELNEPTPNFIVVYDLQSGTLFKKWKPSCNTVSLAISQVNACVIAGLEDAKILVWDLVTGNCRSTLIGHNAPVTFLKLDPLGRVLLSRDKAGRDNSIRVWELNSGKPLAVYKPPGFITTCEILSNAAFVVVALKNRTELLTLALKNYGDVGDDNCYFYGNRENHNKIVNLNEN